MKPNLALCLIGLWLTLTLTSTRAQEPFTAAEVSALDQFRSLLTRSRLFNDAPDFFKSDEYLIHWLRERSLDPRAAHDFLMKGLAWRQETAIENSVSEDFSAFDRNHPFNIDGVDKEGRPVLIAPVGTWRPRQAVLAGQGERYNRFMLRTMLEIPLQKIESLYGGGNDTSTSSVSQYVLIYDMNGINAREHLCLQCIQAYATLMTSAEAYYPRLAHKTFFINSPRVFDTVLNVVRPLMSSFTRDNLYVFDHNRDKWRTELLKVVDESQLPPRYGGSKEFKQTDYYAQSYEALVNA